MKVYGFVKEGQYRCPKCGTEFVALGDAFGHYCDSIITVCPSTNCFVASRMDKHPGPEYFVPVELDVVPTN